MFKTIKNLGKLNKFVDFVENVGTKFADYKLKLTEVIHTVNVLIEDVRRIKEQLNNK